jgi:hypothetical protein
MSNDEFKSLMNRKSSEIRAPRTSPATTDAWRAIMDRPHDDHERRWFIDNWFQTTERLLEAGDELHYQTQHRGRHHPAIRLSMLPRLLIGFAACILGALALLVLFSGSPAP